MVLTSAEETAFMRDHRRVERISKVYERKNRLRESTKQSRTSSISRPTITPAMTMVEECNRAEIGVGADIAFNSHEEKGI